MKAFNNYKMKSVGRKIAVLSMTALLFVSCGSDKDKNETNTGVSGVPVGTSPVFGNPNAGGSQQDLNVWNSLKSSNNCQQGRMSDQTFTLQQQGYSNGNTISGYLQSGNASGTHQGGYYGKSANGDLVYISKVSNGNTLAYNVVLSFCQFSDGINQYIGPNAQMSQYFVNGLVLNNSGTCATGAVSTGQVGFYSPTFGGYVPINVASAGMNCY
ncbi:MAG: hypothetical protein NXH75_05475 [Halobacteriovoraceae bacterium]|nr:hypothetical protein [Halobacteriovoraceae bacterium]